MSTPVVYSLMLYMTYDHLVFPLPCDCSRVYTGYGPCCPFITHDTQHHYNLQHTYPQRCFTIGVYSWYFIIIAYLASSSLCSFTLFLLNTSFITHLNQSHPNPIPLSHHSLAHLVNRSPIIIQSAYSSPLEQQSFSQVSFTYHVNSNANGN